MFLFFSVISLPCNFCQIQPASELDSPSTTELTGEYIGGAKIYSPVSSVVEGESTILDKIVEKN